MIMYDREQPRPEVGAGLPEMFLGESAREGVLHQIIRPLSAYNRCRVYSLYARVRAVNRSRGGPLGQTGDRVIDQGKSGQERGI